MTEFNMTAMMAESKRIVSESKKLVEESRKLRPTRMSPGNIFSDMNIFRDSEKLIDVSTDMLQRRFRNDRNKMHGYTV